MSIRPEATTLNPNETEVFELTSKYVDQTYRLWVSVPSSYHHSDKIYPVLDLLDGLVTFNLTKQIVEILQIPSHIPEVIMVGIAYPVPTHMHTLSERVRDFTPTPLPPDQPTGDYPFKETGGAAKFLQCVETEIIPLIESRYRASEEERALLGWSFGGLFVLYALFEKPDLFNRMIAVSPSAHWDKRSLFRSANESMGTMLKLTTKVFITVESPDELPETKERIIATQQLVEIINESQSDTPPVKLKILTEEDHFSMGPTSITQGLLYIYS